VGDYEKANQIAVLLGGRGANWLEQVAYDGAPAVTGAGAATQGALKTQVLVDLRDEIAHRSCWVTIDTLDLTATYTVQLNALICAYDANAGGAASAQDVLEGIRDEINTTGVALVVASVIDADGDGTDDTVLVRGLGEDNYTIVFGATGTGVLAIVADPDTCDIRLFGSAGGQASSAPPSWRMINGAEWTGVDYRGFSERFDTSSIARLYAEVDTMAAAGDDVTVTYQPGRVVIGPGLEVTPTQT